MTSNSAEVTDGMISVAVASDADGSKRRTEDAPRRFDRKDRRLVIGSWLFGTMDCNAEADDEVKRGRAGMEKPNTAPFLVERTAAVISRSNFMLMVVTAECVVVVVVVGLSLSSRKYVDLCR
jgi:hypothetical protein